MKKIALTIGMALMIAVTAGTAMADYGDSVFGNPIYATQAGASWFDVTDQTVNIWGDDGSGNPVAVGTQDNDNVTVIQGADQNWGGTGNIMPGLINYDNFLGAPDYAAAGYGGAAAGGSLVVAFDQDFVNGDGIDFVVHGFGFCFNQAFSAERGTVNIYVADASYNPTVTAADPDGPGPLGQVTITGDESKWVLLSEWQGWGDWDNDPGTADTWLGNPDMNYQSAPGAYGHFLWGDLEGSGLESARYIKFELGDSDHFINSYTGAEDNTGRALFIDAVEARGYEAPDNHAPDLEPVDDKEVDEGVLLTFILQATDPEEDALTFSYSSNPEMVGATLNPNTGVFAWTPPEGAQGIYAVTFTVTDDGTPPATDQVTAEIAVGNVNHPPVFDDNAPASSYAALEGHTITFEVSATDSDGDTVSYSVSGIPNGADFSNGTFAWTTGTGDAGSYTLEFTATDDGSPSESTTKTVTLTVGSVSQHAGPDQVVTEQTSVTLGVPETENGQSTDTYQWVQTSGPEVLLSDAAAAAPTFIAPKVEGGETVLTFRSTLNAHLTDDVQITVQDNGIQLTEEQSQRLENAELVFDNRIGAHMNALDHCYMGIAGEQGQLTFYKVLDPADMDTGEKTPDNLIYGLFEFNLTLTPGTQTAVWTVFLQQSAPEGYCWYKYNKTSGTWIDFSRDLISGGTGDGAVFNEDRTRVTLYVTDGGAYDDDGIVNLQVSDPSGLGMTTVTTADSGGDGGGGGGGCFINTLVGDAGKRQDW